MGEHRRRRPVQHAVELFVYAPLGLLFEAPHLLPRLVERGRSEATSAVESGRNTLRSLGLVGDTGPAVAEDAGDAGDGRGQAVERTLTAVPEVEQRPPGPDPETLAIPDYESLSASQVVPRLEALAGDELEAIRQFELANRHRSTILNKIAQLQAG